MADLEHNIVYRSRARVVQNGPIFQLTMGYHDLHLIIGALQAVAPSGGGSTQYHLAGALQHGSNIVPKDEFVGGLQMIAYNEVNEHAQHTTAECSSKHCEDPHCPYTHS